MWLVTACLVPSDGESPPVSDTTDPDTGSAGEYGECDSLFGCGLSGDVEATDHGMLLGYRSEGFTGKWVAFAGDVDADGDDDILVTTPGYGGADVGAAHLVLGPFRGVLGVDEAAAATGSDESVYGWGTGPAGDADGDGHDDVLVATSPGGADLFLDPLQTGMSHAAANATFAVEASSVGLMIAGPGEFDGDGTPEILFGDGSPGGPQPYAGFVFDAITSGGAALAGARLRVAANAASVYTGRQATWVGDTDGDGLSEIAFGDFAAGYSGTNLPGQVALVSGGVTGDVNLDDADLLLVGEDSEYLGYSLGGGHDFDGDGTPDLLVGAPGEGRNGTVYVVTGPARGVRLAPDVATATITTGRGALGGPLAPLGDSDGDGTADVFLLDHEGASNSDGHPQVGWILSAPLAGTVDVDDASGRVYDPEGQGWRVDTVAGGGDMNGDQYGDLLIGNMHGTRAGEDYAGEVYLLYGGPPD